jgi:hypothetical protein
LKRVERVAGDAPVFSIGGSGPQQGDRLPLTSLSVA